MTENVECMSEIFLLCIHNFVKFDGFEKQYVHCGCNFDYLPVNKI